MVAPLENKYTFGSRNGDLLVVMVLIALVLSLAWLWISNFYIGTPTYALFSHPASDEPFIPLKGFIPVPIVGSHYFGDFQEPMSWAAGLAQGISPYTLGSTYLPLPPVLLQLVSPLELKTATILFLIFATSLYLFSLVKLLNGFSVVSKVTLVSLLGVITLPYIAMADRGNLQLLVVSLIALGIYFADRRRGLVGGTLLGFAAAFKGYPLLVLLTLPGSHTRRVKSIGTLVLVVLVLLPGLLLPGGLFANISLYLKDREGYADGALWIQNYSFMGLVGNLTKIMAVQDEFRSSLLRFPILYVIPFALWAIAIAYLLKSRQFINESSLFFVSLASLQMISPVSYAFTLGWASVSGLLFMREWREQTVNPMPKQPSDSRVSLFLVTGSIVASITPLAMFVNVSGEQVSISTLLSPLLISLTITNFVRVVYVRKKEYRKNQLNS